LASSAWATPTLALPTRAVAWAASQSARADFAAVMAYKGAYEPFAVAVNLTNRIFDQGTVVSMGQ